MTKQATGNRNPNSALSRLYERQQPKVRASARKGELLKTFAEEDYKRIAMLIKKWLDEDKS